MHPALVVSYFSSGLKENGRLKLAEFDFKDSVPVESSILVCECLGDNRGFRITISINVYVYIYMCVYYDKNIYIEIIRYNTYV